MHFPIRALTLVASIGCILAVLVAAYIEPFASMNPCPMCMMQRALYLATGAIGIVCFFTFGVAVFGRLLAALAAASAFTGMGVAIRQVWLQHLPADQVPACGPGLEYMIEVFPMLEVIKMSLMGTGDCAEIQWQWLGLSIPGWSILLFAGTGLVMLAAALKKRDKAA